MAIIPERKPTNLPIIQDRDFRLVLQFNDQTGTAIDLTGYTWTGEIYKRIGDPSPIAFAFDTTLAISGQITMSLTDVQTGALDDPSRHRRYESYYTDTSGIKVEFLNGEVIIRESGVT